MCGWGCGSGCGRSSYPSSLGSSNASGGLFVRPMPDGNGMCHPPQGARRRGVFKGQSHSTTTNCHSYRSPPLFPYFESLRIVLMVTLYWPLPDIVLALISGHRGRDRRLKRPESLPSTDQPPDPRPLHLPCQMAPSGGPRGGGREGGEVTDVGDERRGPGGIAWHMSPWSGVGVI